MKNIKSIDVMENSDIGYNIQIMDKSYTWQEVVDECYQMDEKPNVIVKNGTGKFILNMFK